jgi:hypothetical protein
MTDMDLMTSFPSQIVVTISNFPHPQVVEHKTPTQEVSNTGTRQTKLSCRVLLILMEY